MEEESQPKSSVLLIDHPSVQPPLTRVRFMDGKMIEKMSVCSTVPPGYSLQNSCNNLLCFAKYSVANAVRLLDLVSTKVIMLPHSRFAKQSPNLISFYGLGFDHRSKVHKTLRIEVVVNPDMLGNYVRMVEFNRLGEGAWNMVMTGHPTGSIFGKPVAVDGALVWADFPQTDAAMSGQRHASAFDLCKEKFFSIRLPRTLRVGHLVALNGKLCAADLSSDSYIHIWVTPNLDGSWDSLCRINIRTVQGEKDHRRTRVIGSLRNGKLLLKSYTAYFTYEATTEKLEFLHLPVGTDPETEVHCYAGELTH